MSAYQWVLSSKKVLEVVMGKGGKGLGLHMSMCVYV